MYITRSFSDSKLFFLSLYVTRAQVSNVTFVWNKLNAFDNKEWSFVNKDLTQPLLGIRVVPTIWPSGFKLDINNLTHAVFLN